MSPTNIVKFLVRRGLDTQRQVATLSQGELAMVTDNGHQRLFVGVGGTNKGGVPVASKLYIVSSFSEVSTLAYVQLHDMVYSIADSRLWALTGAYNTQVGSYLRIATN